jgi:aspartate carbamoyltransferase catalytic subunit
MTAGRPLGRKDLLGIAELSRPEIAKILDTAETMWEIGERPIKKVPTLRGKTVVNLFFEASTRTRFSFELAQKRLSADSVNFAAKGSSVEKGETLVDTAKNLMAMAPDAIVIRHPNPGAPHALAAAIPASIVNAGDGSHEHPTQALLDAFTIRRHFGRLEGLSVLIVGDIAHSRVVRSNIHLLTKMGAEVILCGPPTLMPIGIEALGCRTTDRIDDVLPKVDVAMMLRVQAERGAGTAFPSIREYFRLFGLGTARVAKMKKGSIVMHPGPMNRGVEIASEVADGDRSVILEQVTSGVAVRMAVLYLLLGGAGEES